MDIRVWVGCLAHYNNGDLIGDWVNAVDAPDWTCPQADPSDIYINCEEYWIMDHEIPGVEGEMDPLTARAWGELWDQVDDDDAEAFGLWLDNYHRRTGPGDIDVDNFRESYEGHFDSEKDFAYHLCDDVLDMDSWPKTARNYFDYDAYARDLFMDGYTFVKGYVFNDYV